MVRYIAVIPLVKCLQTKEVGCWGFGCSRALLVPPEAFCIIVPGEGIPILGIISFFHVGVVAHSYVQVKVTIVYFASSKT